MNNKEKNTRIVTFKEDYHSGPTKASKAEPIYKKGSVHAIHKDLVVQLERKGAKMDVKKHDPEPGVKRLRKQLVENNKKVAASASK